MRRQTDWLLIMLYLSPDNLERLSLTPQDVLTAVRRGIEAHANGEGTAEPTLSFLLPENAPGAIYTVRGTYHPSRIASVKVVGAFPDNRKNRLPPDTGLLTLFSLDTGEPAAILDASFITRWRTAAAVAIAGIHLGRSDSRVLACIGSQGIAPLAATLMHDHFRFDEVRIHSRSEDARKQAVAKFSEANLKAVDVQTWEECVNGADIVIDGAALTAHTPLFPASAVGEGQTIVSYGAYSSLPVELSESLDRTFTDRWVDGDAGLSGSVGPLIASGRITQETITGYLGDSLTGTGSGRTSSGERILVWLRGLAECDVTLGQLLADTARSQGIGTELSY